MKILGIETSCDECAAAVVEDGKKVLSNIIATQIPFHKPFNGVVPEIASRKHTEWIYNVVKEALDKARLGPKDIDAVAVTNRPGLLGSLIVGLSFAKAFAWARNIPFIAVDHMLAHLYASQLDTGQPSCGKPPAYPFLGLLVSGGHSIICRADSFDDITVLGATIDDAVGEAFDKVAKHYNFGYPGGAVIDKMARNGDSGAFRFPMPRLHKGAHPCDVSYSGLKNAVINQLELFRVKKDASPEDIAASFQKTAVEILLRALLNAAADSGLASVAAGGGVAANSYLRSRLAEQKGLHCVFPPPEFCGDNGAMIAGIAFHYLSRGDCSPLSITASARVEGFKKQYP
ncbi:MAG: tRNA (adenosine(37)-N6)-threonylcarbamoyltransferase complex transferase subunit TsaD [Treponema sp.]|jgi:N6-L-threonylcarbamoyladenine synthase|nr:tRNA (adenosine(37)-N6)-threonylcarbamoyltransferase complex transferase subunit TsaD [Treponema sp.]